MYVASLCGLSTLRRTGAPEIDTSVDRIVLELPEQHGERAYQVADR